MTETANIAEMAQLLASEVFEVFGWQQVGPLDESWDCARPDTHHDAKHPSDVVFKYVDPYSGTQVYVNVDLKSYGRDSISITAVRAALSNLARAADCGNVSPGFQELFVGRDETYHAGGLLFVYNHDSEYDSDFGRLLRDLKPKDIGLRPGNRLFVVGPDLAAYLKTVANDISVRRGRVKDDRPELPPRANCWFYYPELVRRKKGTTGHGAATLEMLTSRWQILRYSRVSGSRGVSIYARTAGETPDEFLYIIDYMLRYQLLSENDELGIRLVGAHATASRNFEAAKDEYVRLQREARGLRERLEIIKFSTVTSIETRYSSAIIGMERRHG